MADNPTPTWLWMSGFEVRYTPLLAALSYGVTSIEIYLWSEGGVLYVSLCIFPSFSIPPSNLRNLGWSKRPRKAARPRPDPGRRIFLQAAIDVEASKRGRVEKGPATVRYSQRIIPFGRRLWELSSGVFQTAPYLPLQLVMNIKSPGPSCVFHPRTR